MKLALLSDIHANQRALDACLAHARAAGATDFALLGDLVGYGAEPAQVLDTIMALAAAGATVLQGNHDALACAPPASPDGPVATLDASAAAWTQQQLSADQRGFLANLPLTAQRASALLVHASADQPGQWRYVDSAQRAALSLQAASAQFQTRHVFGGHVHHQRLYYRGRGRGLMEFAPTPGVPIPVPAHRLWLATVGSVGQPRDGDTRAMYALFEPARAQLSFHRVPYDFRAAAAAIRASGQPDYFARRLETGQ